MMSDSRLPHFSALRAFEAAARHENFSRAAEELHLTHGAISHQVRALERELGLALFERHGKQVRITAAGAQYARQLAKAFADMAAASAALRRNAVHQRLTIAAVPAFAARWLAPRLGGFIERHPAINVVLQTGEQWLADGVDVAIRRADGAYPGWLVAPVMVEVGDQAVSPHYHDGSKGYLMLLPAVAEQRPQVQAFRDWLQEEVTLYQRQLAARASD
ncbi:LysR family transcriptional regulator [Pseudoduganella danionis]|uniref:LysR family transcriptional regulator n=2 Tax=Pseudoduganella danionis TaxID=1890295 RepID=A0ABW9SVF4_9BURK|nr:LysR family transcriptional regulator [Pseudoduganella danionis]